MDEENEIQRNESAAPVLERPRPASGSPYETAETEETLDLLAYWRVIRKRRWTILTIFVTLVAIVFVWTLMQKPVYRATALIEIERESPDIPTGQEPFEIQDADVSSSYLETQYKILGSITLARRVIEQLGLEKLEEFNPPSIWAWLGSEESQASEQGNSPAAFQPGSKSYHKVLRSFDERLAVRPVRRSRLVEVSFESQDPELAARVANALVATYVKRTVEEREKAIEEVSEWVTRQLAGVKSRLAESEKELQAYVRRNGLQFLDAESSSENIVNRRLRQLQAELTSAEAARHAKESLHRLVEAGDYGSLPRLYQNVILEDLLTIQVTGLRRDLEQLAAASPADDPQVKRLQSQIDEIESILARERERVVERVANDYRAAVGRESLVRQAFEGEQKRARQISDKLVQYNILKREVETNKSLYGGLLGRLKQTVVSAELKFSNIRIIDAADPPDRPVRPRWVLNLALAVIFGLSLGIGGAFLQEHLDNSLKSPEDVERILRVPTLAVIPSVNSLNDRWHGVSAFLSRWKWPATGKTMPMAEQGEQWLRIDQNGQQNSALSEAVRSLRSSVLLATPKRLSRSLLVSSAQLGEGKTTIASNFAISLAQLGHRVLLIDSDMRNPCVHKVFEIKDKPGLVTYLTSQQDWKAMVRPVGLAGLDALVSGPVPPNPTELLSSERMRTLVREATADYNFVVLDSPPLLYVADSRILATLVEGVLLVVQVGATPCDLVQRAQFQLRDVGANVIGVVLNKLDVRADDYYYYRYYRYDYYGSKEEPPEAG
jgi:capsular exopolysaccharide synthesis family protein